VDGFEPQVLLDGRVHVVPRDDDAVEHVGFEHGVIALARELNAIISETVAFELQVMA